MKSNDKRITKKCKKETGGVDTLTATWKDVRKS